ncbi:unnamed protein product, partial [Rotaria sordida]
ETENLLAHKIHLQTIITGWRNVTNEALIVLEDVANNNSSNLQQFKSDLMNIARTTLSLGSNLNDSRLEESFLSEKRIRINIPKRIENAPI